MGYLFIPGLLTLVSEKLSPIRMYILSFILAGIAMTDIFYLKEKWINNRYISINYFYRNSEPLPYQDKLDYTSYQKLIEIDQRLTR